MKQFLFFKLQRLIGSRVESYYRQFLDLERKTLQELKDLQYQRLQAILQHAVSEVPFYRERVECKNEINLADFPVLTKEKIRNHFQELMASQLRKEYRTYRKSRLSYSWLEVKTGGSTGVPLSVIHDAEFRDRGRAGRLYSQYLCGFPFGEPYFRLWGSMREINHMKESSLHRLMTFLSNETILNAFRMDDKNIEKYIEIVNASSVNHMMAYIDAAHQVAKYALKTDRWIKPLKSIMACAGTVHDDIRQTLKQVFQANIHNKYGSRDCAEMACECEEGGLHIYCNHVIIEVVDSQGVPLQAGETGRILVTLLSNYSFPLIRYEIGDLGSISADQCPCGRSFPLLARIDGRSVEYLMSNDGGYVTPAYIIHLIGVVHNPGFIRRFQLIQSSAVEYTLKVQLDPNVPEKIYSRVELQIKRDLKAVFGIKSNINVSKVDEIQPSVSGKFLYTINKVINIKKT